jgi:hypothetical protein
MTVDESNQPEFVTDQRVILGGKIDASRYRRRGDLEGSEAVLSGRFPFDILEGRPPAGRKVGVAQLLTEAAKDADANSRLARNPESVFDLKQDGQRLFAGSLPNVPRPWPEKVWRERIRFSRYVLAQNCPHDGRKAFGLGLVEFAQILAGERFHPLELHQPPDVRPPQSDRADQHKQQQAPQAETEQPSPPGNLRWSSVGCGLVVHGCRSRPHSAARTV